MGRRNGMDGSGTRAVIEHSDQGSSKHQIDVAARARTQMMRMSAHELRTYGRVESHDLVQKGELEFDLDQQGYVLGVGICSTKRAKEASYDKLREFDGLRVRIPISGGNSRAARSQKKKDKRLLEAKDCLQKRTFTFSPAVSAWWARATKPEREYFCAKVMPMIGAWSELRFPEAKFVNLQLHCDTAHLHFDCFMAAAEIYDFGKRTGEALLYKPKAMQSQGVGIGICHLARKKEAYDLAGLELSTIEQGKLDSGLKQGQELGRLHDLTKQTELDNFCLGVIGKKNLDPITVEYARAEKSSSPYVAIESLLDRQAESRRLDAINKQNVILVDANKRLKKEAQENAGEIKKSVEEKKILAAEKRELQERIDHQDFLYEKNMDEIIAKKEKSMGLDSKIREKEDELCALQAERDSRVTGRINELLAKSVLASVDQEEARALLASNLEDFAWCEKAEISIQEASQLKAQLKPKPQTPEMEI